MEIKRIASRFWGFAYVRVNTEKKVASVIQNMGVLSYLPTIPRARMQHSKKVISYIPMIPSYVFLCLNDSERTELKKREKRIVEIDLMRNIIMEDLLIRELNILQQCEQLSSRVPIVVNPGVVAGDRVIIKSGELAGYETVVVSRDDEHNIIIVNLTILNKHVEYSVRQDSLKKMIE